MSCDFIFLCTPKACLFHLIREAVRGRCLACMQNVGSMEKTFRVCNKILPWNVMQSLGMLLYRKHIVRCGQRA
jgi:hypothetical protein